MPEPPRPGVGRGLLGARLTASLMPLNSTMVAVAVPDISEELGHSLTAVTQALVATYLVTAIALQSPGGKLGDRLGPWRAVWLGQGALAAGALLALVAPSLAVLALARVVMACGGALVVPATVALLRAELPAERRGRAFGSFGATMALAAAAGPVVGGVLVHAFSWEAVFLVNVPVLAVGVLLCAQVPRRTAAPSALRFDAWGSALLTLALVLVVVGAQDDGYASLLLVAAGLLVLVLFGRWEQRAADPVVDLALFRSLSFTAGASLTALHNLVMYGLLFELPLVLADGFDLSPQAIGQLLTALMLSMVAMSLLAGRWTDRFGPRPVAVGGALVCIAALLLLRLSDLAGGGAQVPLVLLGAGLGLAAPAAQTASMSAVPSSQSGMAAGVGSTMRYLGGVVGILLLGRVLDLDGDRAQVLAEHRAVLALFLAALVVSLVCAALLPSRVRAVQQQHGQVGP